MREIERREREGRWQIEKGGGERENVMEVNKKKEEIVLFKIFGTQ